METVIDSNGVKFQQYNGTCYHHEINKTMIMLLEHIRICQTRVRFYWGDVKTGRDWGDDCDVKGRIGRSSGSVKIPILLYNSRSTGGGAILDHCIVKITKTNGGYVLYEHPNYHIKKVRTQ
ncbi:hypothetical protein LCGC14_1567040 [marine sediment metagenome]|uniref:Uncharacterized protein n=1 Tax=marine sediment metagenome TaxID=412755 RepID=A0A0F9LLB9_9ZZZZ